MIVELLLSPIFFLINSLINFIPPGYSLPQWGVNFFTVVSRALAFFPRPVFVIIVSNVLFWLTLHMTWAIIEWVYKKIPGVS